MARHLVRLDAAVLVPRPHVPQHLDPGHFHLLPLRATAASTAGKASAAATGTCGHVWQYAHAVARLFPELERDTRERVDFGLALKPDGAIHFRGEFNDIPAIDAQAGTILRALREHQMSPTTPS